MSYSAAAGTDTSRNKMMPVALTAAGIWFVVVAAGLASTPIRGYPREPGVVPQEDVLYGTAIDTVYNPHRGNFHGGVVLLQMQSVSGFEYLSDSSIIAAVRRHVPATDADSLIASYRSANATSHWLDGHVGYVVGRAATTFLDTSTVRHMLAPGDAEPMNESIVTDMLEGMPLDSLPGVLALSVPGITPDGDTALLFASLRERRSVEADHLEAAAFLLLRREDLRWHLAVEIPVPGSRRR
jgi:hypothetical protein